MSVQHQQVPAVPESSPQAPKPEVSAAIEQAHETFRRDLPELLKERPGQWVAYYGEQRLGVGQTKTAVYQACLNQGYEPGTFLVRRIRPQPLGDLLGTLEAL